MAVISNANSFMEYPKGIKRQGGFPLDLDSLYTSLEAAKTFAETSPKAYVGMPLYVVDANAGKAEQYIIQDTAGNLKLAGGANVVVKTVEPTAADDKYDVGQAWLNTTTKKMYVLFDNTATKAVWVRSVTPDELEEVTSGGMLASIYAKETGAGAATGYVDKALKADKLTTGRKVSVAGDVTGETTFDGSVDATINVTLANSGVTAGTYKKVTVDAKGRVTSGADLIAADIPDLTLAKITDAGSAASKTAGNAAGNVPVLDENGKLNTAVIPAIALKEYTVVQTKADMLAQTSAQVQKGDMTGVIDENITYILMGDDPSNEDNWTVLLTPTTGVESVNGKVGIVVLNSDDIAEGSTNLYWTIERFNDALGTKTTDDIAEGEGNLYFTNERVIEALKNESITLIFDGGNAGATSAS